MQRRIYIHVLRYYVSLFFCFTFFHYCEAQEKNTQSIIAQIGADDTVTFTELHKYTYDHLYALLYRNNIAEGYKRGLEEIIDNKLKIIDFFNLGLQNNKELLHGIRRTINEELLVQYHKTLFYSKYVNNESIQKAYKDISKEVLYRQIVLAKPENTSKKQLDSLKALANDLKKNLEKGADFTKLAKKYSQDIDSSGSGGNISAINWKASLSNMTDHIIYDLVAGEIRILEDNRSVRLIKVVEIKKMDVRPFDEVKDDILKTLDERYMDISLEEFEKAKEKLVDEKSLKWNEKAIKQLLKWSNNPGFYKGKYADTLQRALSSGRNFLILRYLKGSVDLKEYLRLLDEVLILGKSGSLVEDDIKKFILEAVRTNIIIQKANELNLEKDIFHSRTANPVIRGEIVRLYNQKVIEVQIPKATDEVLHKFYENNRDSLFYQLAKVNIYAVIASEKNTIDELKLKLGQNIPFEKLTGRVFVKTFIRDREGIIRSFLSIEEPFLGENAFKLKLDEIAGPIEYNDPQKGKQYVLIKCVDKREEKQLFYKDVEKTISDEFIKYSREKITRENLESLKKKYPVVIFKDVLRQNLSLIGINLQ